MENKRNKRKYGRLATPEEIAEYKRLVDGCDRYYFGIDGEPQIVPESAESGGYENVAYMDQLRAMTWVRLFDEKSRVERELRFATAEANRVALSQRLKLIQEEINKRYSAH